MYIDIYLMTCINVLCKKNVFLGVILFFSLLQVSLRAVARPGCPCRQDVLKLTELELVQGIVHLLSLRLFYFVFHVSVAVSPRYVTYAYCWGRFLSRLL